MASRINIADVYDKNLNFLLGSGASFGVLPTLGLSIRDEFDEPHTIESLATTIGEADPRFIPLFMHYYAQCIEPAQKLTLAQVRGDEPKESVFKNYMQFLETTIRMLLRRKPNDRHCNLFTTNYDGCIPQAADELLKIGAYDFVLNDGSRGFLERSLQVRNFLSSVMQTGAFERHLVSIPQINLIHLHGSVYWRKTGEQICVDYASASSGLLNEETRAALVPFSEVLAGQDKTIGDLHAPEVGKPALDQFWEAYRKLPIVNPTKWKFHETVFDEHYYQMLRMLSFELEKPNSVLITFGFSFADEHILSLVKRSLSNPTLQLFVCCFDKNEAARMREQFKPYKNVEMIEMDEGVLTFSAFNDSVLSLDETKAAIGDGVGAGSSA